MTGEGGAAPAAGRRKVVVDCDPGIDDAIALMLAFASPGEIEVLGVTTVAGNVPLDAVAANARRLRALCGVPEVPVFAGCPRPLLRPPVTARQVHGADGLGNAVLPPPAGAVSPVHAVDFLRDTIRAAPGEITVVAVGPLTNLAVALVQRPELAREVREVVVMGGAAGSGNVTPHAEFNFHVDPHAARIVLESGAPVALYGLDLTRQVRAGPDFVEWADALGTPVGRAAAGMLAHYRATGGALHDVCAVGHLLRPDCFRLEPCVVRVETEGARAGQTVVARAAAPEEANARMAFEANPAPFLAFLRDRLARYPAG